jgi:serine protease Do
VGRTLTLADGETVLRDVVTVDSTPDPRQDGAPLLNGNGDVIGVVVDAGGAAPGVVALSMTAASNIVAKATGSGGSAPVPTLGADSEVIDPATAAAADVPVGALILSVTNGGPAATAGLLAGDVVTAVGSTTLDATHPFDPTILGLAPDQQVTITVFRNGTTRTLELIVGSG